MKQLAIAMRAEAKIETLRTVHDFFTIYYSLKQSTIEAHGQQEETEEISHHELSDDDKKWQLRIKPLEEY